MFSISKAFKSKEKKCKTFRQITGRYILFSVVILSSHIAGTEKKKFGLTKMSIGSSKVYKNLCSEMSHNILCVAFLILESRFHSLLGSWRVSIKYISCNFQIITWMYRKIKFSIFLESSCLFPKKISVLFSKCCCPFLQLKRKKGWYFIQWCSVYL